MPPHKNLGRFYSWKTSTPEPDRSPKQVQQVKEKTIQWMTPTTNQLLAEKFGYMGTLMGLGSPSIQRLQTRQQVEKWASWKKEKSTKETSQTITWSNNDEKAYRDKVWLIKRSLWFHFGDLSVDTDWKTMSPCVIATVKRAISVTTFLFLPW